jgi:nucleoid DNA-binding protein
MTKKDMARTIAEGTGVHKAQVREIVQRVFDGIIETLVQEGRIELRNFGVFEVKKRKPRQGRNPKTGEKVCVCRPVKSILIRTSKPARSESCEISGERYGARVAYSLLSISPVNLIASAR